MRNSPTTFLLCLLGLASTAAAHGIPIKLFVEEGTNQLIVPFEYDTGTLPGLPPFQYTATVPGISVVHSADLRGQVPLNSEIHFDVVQSLLYWDGSEVTAAPTTLTIHAPTQDNLFRPHASPIATYDVTATSGAQTGMTWGRWPGGSFWQVDGQFELPETAAPGVYGVAVQLSMEGTQPSDPLLITQTFDPGATIDGGAGRAALMSHVVPEPSAIGLMLAGLVMILVAAWWRSRAWRITEIQSTQR